MPGEQPRNSKRTRFVQFVNRTNPAKKTLPLERKTAVFLIQASMRAGGGRAAARRFQDRRVAVEWSAA